jgi:3-hydroxyacyl-[acyl-carrier-protein] dehydratase
MTLDDDLDSLFQRACREPLLDDRAGSLLGPEEIEQLLPHRAPFRLIDRVHRLSRDPAFVVCSRYLSPEDPVFGGHFPGHPVYPGVLQVEAVGQAGLIYHQLAGQDALPASVSLTHVHRARFVRPCRAGELLEVVATGAWDGLFFTVVGQCLVAGRVVSSCAVALVV